LILQKSLDLKQQPNKLTKFSDLPIDPSKFKIVLKTNNTDASVLQQLNALKSSPQQTGESSTVSNFISA